MKKYCTEWIEEWCRQNGWTDLFMERHDHFWAFPPGGVMPMPIPSPVLQRIKAEYGLTPEEKLWRAAAWLVTFSAITWTYVGQTPMPIVLAFAFVAICVAMMEND